MIQQITPLPTPPQPSDSPVEFDQKAFTLLGGLPQFVSEANSLGMQIFNIGEASAESAAAALESKNSATTSASNSAASATASGQSASNSASSANAANQARIDAQAAAATAVSISGGMESAIAFANTFTAVPSTNQGPMVVVTQPHLRFMVWNGVKYVRAPWHSPGVFFHSDAPPEKINHAIQLRSDVLYNTADHPDLAELYGFTGATFNLKDARARVFRGADLGKGTDAALVNGYLQEDAIRNITGTTSRAYFAGQDQTSGVFQKSGSAAQPVGGTDSVDTHGYSFDASRQVPTALENRVKSLVGIAYITR